MTAAGLQDVDAELTFRLVTGGSPASAFYVQTMTERADRVVAAGLLSRADADAVIAFSGDPASRWLALGVVTAHGRRR